eukprot:297197-Amphidinium_carterae.1
MVGNTGPKRPTPPGTQQGTLQSAQWRPRTEPEALLGQIRLPTPSPQGVETSGWGGPLLRILVYTHQLTGRHRLQREAKVRGLGVPAQQPPWAMVGAKRRRRGANRHSSSRLSRAWSHQPARTQAIAPEPKKRPHSASPRDTASERGCNNLQGVTVAKVDGELRAFGPRDKVGLVDPITMQLLYAGDRRSAQERLRQNRRAIRHRYEEHLPDGQGTPEQLLCFAEAKARKMPWDDDRTMRFIVYGEDPAMAPGEPVVHVQVGLGEPALLSTHPS